MGRRGGDIAPRVRHRGSHGLRLQLMAGCALAGVALSPGLAHAQLAYVPAATVFSAGGTAPTVGQTAHTTDVTLGAQRTILNWSSYNLAADQTVIYRFQNAGGIVLNRITGQAVVDGTVEALVGAQRGAGAVWFAAPGGVIFGPNARVNVGGLLATSAAVMQASFLDAANASIDFTGAGSGQVLVRSGAQLRSSGGGLALIAGSVVTEQGSTTTSGSTVLLGAANDFTVRFGSQAGDLDLLDFVIPAGGGTASAAPLTLAGQTVGGNVILAVVNRAEVASAVISAPGLIAAQSAAADRGDVILSAGASIINRQPGPTRLNATTATTATFGVVSAQRDLLGGFAQPTTLAGAQVSAGRDLGVSAASQDFGGLNAGRLLALDATGAITLRSGASSGAAASFRTAGALSVGTGAAINAAGRLTIDTGTLNAPRLNSGRSIVVTASGANGAAGVAALNVGQALAGDDISLTATNATGSVVLGSAQITGAGADEAPLGRTLTLAARGANGDVTYGVTAGSPLTGATRVFVTAGHDATVSVLGGVLSLGASSAGGKFTIRASDLDLTGAITAGTLRIESLAGGFTLGGGGSGSGPAGGASAGPEGLQLTDAEFQRIRVTGEADFYAGATDGAARGDLVVLDLSVNPANLPRLLLAAGPGNDISVTGVLAPTVSGGVLTLGEAAAGSAFQPGRILLSGAIGASTGSPDEGFTNVRAFDEVGLNARTDIILGSQRFIALVNGLPANQIDVANNIPVGVAPQGTEIGHIFLTAGVLTLAAPAKIVQENTGTRAKGSGFYLTNLTAAPRDTVLTVTSAQVVDLFGSIRDKNGVLRSGAQAARATQVIGFGAGNSFTNGDVRFNGVETGAFGAFAGSGGNAAGPVEVAAQGVTQVASVLASVADDAGGLDGDDAGSGDGGGTAVGPSPDPVLISIAKPDVNEIVSDPIELGSGNDEVWRSKAPKK